MHTILVIEDDVAIQRGLSDALTAEHYRVLVAGSGGKGVEQATSPGVALIILDLVLPDKGGVDVCRELRAKGVRTPILMLTSKAEEIDKVIGLEVGADDYVTKPFGIRELIARIGALLRRTDEVTELVTEFKSEDLYINFKTMEVARTGAPVMLTALEFQVLRYFVSRVGKVISRDELLNKVWGYDNFPTTRAVDTIILSLRKKLEVDPSDPKCILTVHGIGYKFREHK